MAKNTRRARMALLGMMCVVAAVVGLLPAQAQNQPNPVMITVEGGGWGHGIGMSQYGAYGRAAAGQSYADILGFYYPGSGLSAVEDFDDIRIHIHSAHGTRINPVNAPSGDPADDIQIVDGDGNLIFNHRNGRPLTVDKVKGGFTITRTSTNGNSRNVCLHDDDGDRCEVDEIRFRFQQGNPIKVNAIDRVSIGTDGNSYQWGELVISERDRAPNQTLYVVLEQLTLDQYIYGLAEVPSSWPAATLQAQSVAARTYGYDRATTRRASSAWDHPWDLYSTVDDQVYHGLAKEIGEFGPAWVSAVNATSNEVLFDDGDPITAFYSSSNGGWTEDSGYVFVTSLPYLPAQRDTFDSHENPFASWTRDYTGAELGRWFARSNIISSGTVTNVAVRGNIGRSGRVDRATVELDVVSCVPASNVRSSVSVQVNGSRCTVVLNHDPNNVGNTGGNLFRNVINVGVSSEGGGLSRQVLSTKYEVFGTGTEEPVGALDRAKRRKNKPTRLRVAGWVFDADSSSPVPVEIRVDNKVVQRITTGQSRYDIDAIFGEGSSRGFDVVLDVNRRAHQVCAYADNVGTGEAMLLGCQAVPRA